LLGVIYKFIRVVDFIRKLVDVSLIAVLIALHNESKRIEIYICKRYSGRSGCAACIAQRTIVQNVF
jgi:hypothetical protein